MHSCLPCVGMRAQACCVSCKWIRAPHRAEGQSMRVPNASLRRLTISVGCGRASLSYLHRQAMNLNVLVIVVIHQQSLLNAGHGGEGGGRRLVSPTKWPNFRNYFPEQMKILYQLTSSCYFCFIVSICSCVNSSLTIHQLYFQISAVRVSTGGDPTFSHKFLPHSCFQRHQQPITLSKTYYTNENLGAVFKRDIPQNNIDSKKRN